MCKEVHLFINDSVIHLQGDLYHVSSTIVVPRNGLFSTT